MTSAATALLSLGDHVEVTTPVTGREPVAFLGTVTALDHRYAQVTDASGTGAMAVPLDSPSARVLTPGKPAVAACPECQTEVFETRVLCSAHAPTGL